MTPNRLKSSRYAGIPLLHLRELNQLAPRSVNLQMTRILFQNIELDTVDAQDIVISPNGGFIAAYDVPLLVSRCISKLLVVKWPFWYLTLPPGQYKLSIYRPDGTMEAAFSVDDGGLGIKNLCWSPDSQFLAVGGYDHKVCFSGSAKRKKNSTGIQGLTLSTASVAGYIHMETRQHVYTSNKVPGQCCAGTKDPITCQG